ncbi:Glucosidase 2 subunit beta, partial [Pseudolycoriella hygida]
MSTQTNVNFISTELNQPLDASNRKKIIRGIRLRDYDLYNPSIMAMFKCMMSKELIPIEKVNDDYCDCPEDGSDEPETN